MEIGAVDVVAALPVVESGGLTVEERGGPRKALGWHAAIFDEAGRRRKVQRSRQRPIMHLVTLLRLRQFDV